MTAKMKILRYHIYLSLLFGLFCLYFILVFYFNTSSSQTSNRPPSYIYIPKEVRAAVILPTDDRENYNKFVNLVNWKIIIDKSTKHGPQASNLINSFNEAEHFVNTRSFQVDEIISKKQILNKLHKYLYMLNDDINFIYNICDKCTLTGTVPEVDNIREYMLFYDGTEYFNPNYHFGEQSVMPLGIPNEGTIENLGQYRLYKTDWPAVQHFLVSPDEEQNRLTHGIKLNKIGPSVAISKNVFAPFTSENSLYSYKAFWALVETENTITLRGQIVKSYWIQRLVWEIGETVAIFPPNAIWADNYSIVHKNDNEVKDFNKLTQLLRVWKCERSLSFFECVIRLSKDMENSGFWTNNDVMAIQAWLNDLISLDYDEPSRIFETDTQSDQIVYDEDYREVNYQPMSSRETDEEGREEQLEDIREFCNDSTFSFQSGESNFKRMTTTLLIVTFNSPFYTNIPTLELFYKGLFKHRVYCGQFYDKFQEASKEFDFNVTFVEFPVQHAGIDVHMCIPTVMRLNYNVDSYLVLGDDILLNWWHIVDFPRDRFWFPLLLTLYRNNRTRAWDWWQLNIGQEAYNNFWEDLMNRRLDDENSASMIDNFVFNMEQNTGSKYGTVHGYSDLIFIPGRFKRQILFFMNILYKNKVFVELSIPNIIAGLVLKRDVFQVMGKFLWAEKRDKVPEYFNDTYIFMHGVKLSLGHKLDKFLCEDYFINYL